MPGLTYNAVVLATSQGCPRQIVRFSPKHYAFQAHLEFDPKAIDLLIAADGEEYLRKQIKSYLLFKHLNNCVPTIILK